MLRVSWDDPEYKAVLRLAGAAPGCKAVRLVPGLSPMDRAAFTEGRYDELIDDAAQLGFPLFLYLPDAPEEIAKCAAKHPGATLVVDHCGLYTNAMRAALSNGAVLTMDEQTALYARVLRLAWQPNVMLKWAHASAMFAQPSFPGAGLQPILRGTLDAFGAERVLWASDFSVNQFGECWGELVYGMLAGSGLTPEELAAVMGGNARRVLRWNA